jgi:prevent-host-death family protein
MTIKAKKIIGVAEAKKHLSELLGRILDGGESFVIARRGRPVARLGPLDRPKTPHLADTK